MRLTLRTLLAYLDDTLDPAEIKEIGQKVAESDAAQELIARIKQVTRRRRIMTPPPTGPQARFEPNTAAEYLENVLPPEQIAEVEKLCLESDAHLSEIAACHQILTLVLGEPALVPPTAKQRMYALIQGKAAVTRKAKAKAPAGAAASHAGDGHEADETLLLGMPPLGKGWNTRYLMPAAVVMLVAALAVAIYMALPKRNNQQLASNLTTNRERPQPPIKDKPTPGSEYETLAMMPRVEVVKVPNGDGATTQGPIKPPPPSTDRKEVGKVALVPGNTPTLVLQQRGQEGWRRLRTENDPVFTHEPLLTLPGFRAEIRLDAKVHLLLWGNVPQQIQTPLPLLESAVTLHAVSADKPDTPEVDFTLERGRVTITNQKSEPVRVRVRFQEEVWDLTLQDPGTEVGVEILGREGGFQTGERPLAFLTLFTLKGHAQIKIGYHRYALQAPPGPAMFNWTNTGPGAQGPGSIPEMLPWWTKPLPATWQWEKLPPVEQKNRMTIYVDMEISLKEMSKRLTADKSLSVLLDEDLTSPRASTRELAVLAMGAIGSLSELLTALADEKHPDTRETAVVALRHWLGREQGQDKKLRQALEEKRYSPIPADTILQLLHTFAPRERGDKQTYVVLIDYLRHDSTAIRQLAYWHLVNLVPDSRKIPYDPGASAGQNAVGYEQWRKLLDEGKLPPRQAPPPPKG